MKHLAWPVLLLALASGWSLGNAEVICQWDFNSLPADDLTSTGRTVPSYGCGTASILGGLTGAFGAGSSKDPAASDNSCWSLSKFPQVMVSNRMAGVRFDVPTTGYERISISWVQQNSATASRYARLQYSTDGIGFQDLPAYAILKDSAWTNINYDLSALSEVEDNSSFSLQIVTEFESTAAGGLPGYMPTSLSSSYLPSGSIKLDMVTVSGVMKANGNYPPFITGEILPLTLRAGQSSGLLSFTVLDAEDPASNLQVSAASSDPTVVRAEAIVFGGSGPNRTCIVTAGEASGTATVTLRVHDSGNKSASYSFSVRVEPANSPPFLSCPGPVYLRPGQSTANVQFAAFDFESGAQQIPVTVTSLNPALLPQTGLQLSGAGTNWLLAISPAAGLAGVAPVRIEATDGASVAFCGVPCVVLPSSDSILHDDFIYPDGSLVAASGDLWYRRSGSNPDFLVSDGRLSLSHDRTEDVAVLLNQGPFETGSNTTLYVGFKMRVMTVPVRPTPDYFAHLTSGSAMIAKLFIGTNSTTDFLMGYRLSLTNAAQGGYAVFPKTMSRGTMYSVVLRYEVDTGSARLWVDPANEESPSVVGLDASPGRVSAFGLRQSSGIGPELLIDDLRIGLTFESATASGTSGDDARPRLRWVVQGQGVSLSWDDPQYRLQAAAAAAGPFTNVAGAVSPHFWQTTTGQRGFFRLSK